MGRDRDSNHEVSGRDLDRDRDFTQPRRWTCTHRATGGLNLSKLTSVFIGRLVYDGHIDKTFVLMVRAATPGRDRISVAAGICAHNLSRSTHTRLFRRHVERKISSFSEWHQVSSSIPMLDRLIAGAFLLSEITITPIANHSFHAFRSAQAANEVPPSSRRTPLFFHRDLALTR